MLWAIPVSGCPAENKPDTGSHKAKIVLFIVEQNISLNFCAIR